MKYLDIIIYAVGGIACAIYGNYETAIFLFITTLAALAGRLFGKVIGGMK